MQGNQEFHSKFQTERLKRNVVDNYFKTIKRKLTRPGQNAIVFYRDGTFPSRGPGGREGVLTGSLKQACKRHFLSRSAKEHRLSRSCVFCKQEDITKTEDHAYCQHCVWRGEVCPQRQARCPEYPEKRHLRCERMRKAPRPAEAPRTSAERLCDSFAPRLLNFTGKGRGGKCRMAFNFTHTLAHQS
jgi:hypothetical protein